MLFSLFFFLFLSFSVTTTASLSLSKRANFYKVFSYRILGGQEAHIDLFPFIAYIQIKVNESQLQCSGSLISPNTILTAAHCLIDEHKNTYSPSNITVGLGSKDNLKKNSNTFSVQKVIPHPNFDIYTAQNDIGIIILSEKVLPEIAIPTHIYNLNITEDLTVETAGWGYTSGNYSQGLSPTLQHTPVLITEKNECSKNFFPWFGNNNSSICTTNIPGNGACYGDSGGPLIASDILSRPLVGITSKFIVPGNNTDTRCGVKGQLVYYTNPSNYMPWIVNQTGISESDMLYNYNSLSSKETSTFTNYTSTLSPKSSSSLSLKSSYLLPLVLCIIDFILF
ncbi:hypothetical protein BB561_004596 [Smittium simulii]|uniref:Peptidase S1 domain-containing protein n=1 Tax=Smittium simulii TaxID=133385 RepID=A0A2T9YFD8_9FUNG|nr:hypothetical protein BB561_004596 [Smittium simulii]